MITDALERVQRLVTPPAVEPVSLAEAKEWARVTGADDDDLVETLIAAARRHVEELTGRALITQTWDTFLPAFPCEILLRPRVQSVTTVKYIDPATGTQLTLASSEYTVDLKAEPGRIVPAYGKSWPSTRCVPNAVEVRHVCGYGNDAESIAQEAEDLLSAIKILVSTLDKNRETIVTGTIVAQLPVSFRQLISGYRV